MTKEELINKILNNRSFDLRSSEFYEPWDISDETIKDMADDFYYLLKDVLNYLAGKEEPASDFTKALAECIHQAQCAVVDPMAHAEIWKEELIKLAKSEEPVSEELEEAAIMHYKDVMEYEVKIGLKPAYMTSFKAGAKWQKENLWKDAQGDDLPEIDREVVVFTQDFPNDAGIMAVAIGHRPNPEGWDGKSLSTGKVEHYTPKTYDKGGWNIPDVKFWLDVELPKEIEL